MSFNKQPLTDKDLKWTIGATGATIGIALFWVLVTTLAFHTGLLWSLYAIFGVGTLVCALAG